MAPGDLAVAGVVPAGAVLGAVVSSAGCRFHMHLLCHMLGSRIKVRRRFRGPESLVLSTGNWSRTAGMELTPPKFLGEGSGPRLGGQ